MSYVLIYVPGFRVRGPPAPALQKGTPLCAGLAALWACCAQWGSLDVRKATPGAFFKSTVPHGTPKCAKCSPRTVNMEPTSKKLSPKATRRATFR